MQTLTVKEQKAIDRLRRAFIAIPDSIRLYCIDMEILACKVGVSAYDLEELVGAVHENGAVLPDLHDDKGYGAPQPRMKADAGNLSFEDGLIEAFDVDSLDEIFGE